MNIIPKRKQWQKWSLPSKYSFLGFLLTLLFGLVGVIFNPTPSAIKATQESETFPSGIFTANSNILDVYFKNERLTYTFDINNTTNQLWENVEVLAFFGGFANRSPLLEVGNHSLIKIHNEKSPHLLPSKSKTIDLGKSIQQIRKQLDKSADDMIFNPFVAGKTRTDFHISPIGKNTYLQQMTTIRNVLKYGTDIELLFGNSHKYGGFIIFIVLSYSYQKDGQPLKITKVIPFANVWTTKEPRIVLSNDVFVINSAFETAVDIIEHRQIKQFVDSDSRLIYNLQDIYELDMAIRPQNGQMEHFISKFTSPTGRKVTGYTFILIGNKGRKYLAPAIQPTIQPGGTIADGKAQF